MTTFLHHSVLKGSITTFLICLMFGQWILEGCSNDGPVKPKVEKFATVDVTGEVDSSEIGGDGHKIVSAWDEVRQVSDSGRFSIIVSDSAAQLLLLKDNDEAIRAFAITLPVDPDSSRDPVEFDARSTALSILMLTPGLLVVQRDEAAQRMQELESLAGFPLLVSRLRDRLATGSLAVALDDSLVAGSIEACVGEWMGTPPPAASGRLARLGANWGHFTTEVLDSDNPAQVMIQLTNKASRDINVYRRTVGANDSTIGTEAIFFSSSSMPGPDLLSLRADGSGDFVHATDIVDLRCGREIDRVEYWMTGVGWGDGGQIPDGSLHQDYEKHRLYVTYTSVLDYLVRPFISILAGAFIRHQTLNQVTQGISRYEGLIKLMASTNEAEARAAMKALFIELAKNVILIAAGALQWGMIGAIFAMISAFIAWYVIIGALIIWSATPPTDMRYVDNPIKDTCDDEIPPGAITDLSVLATAATSVTLGLTMTGDDGVSGQAGSFDIRYSTEMITESNWSTAHDPTDEPVPPLAGQPATYQVTGLQPETQYYFAARVGDEVPNWSDLSNVITSTTEAPTATHWEVSFTKGGTESKELTCGYWTPCTWCPQKSQVYFLKDAWPVTFLDIDIESYGDSVFHSSTGWSVEGAGFGSFDLSTASMDLEGEVGDSLLSFRMVFYGTLVYPALFADPGPFVTTFTVENARLNDGRYTGTFAFNGEAQSVSGHCINFDYAEGNWGGTVTISVTQSAPARPTVTDVSFSAEVTETD